MDIQHDLFGAALAPIVDDPIAEPALLPLAAPCGFRNRKNAPCQRLAHRPLRCDGKNLKSNGRPLLHCVMECFNGPSAEDLAAQLEEAIG